MIQPNELRIGNWVKDTESDMNIKVAGLDPYEIFVGEIDEEKEIYDCRDIEPIPLTDELLKKCGFREIVEKVFVHGEMVNLMKGDNGYCLYDRLSIDISSLHQLQNIFFSLTGKELEIEIWKKISKSVVTDVGIG